MSHRQFNKLAEVLNGPWPSTVETWQEISKFDIFVPSESAKEACDMHFAEAQAVNRPRSTYLQNQDHKLYTYNLMKMFNSCHVPILQFVADGDSRFRNHMLTMSGYTVEANVGKMSFEYLNEQAFEIMEEGRRSGWEIPKITAFDALHFFFTAEEMHRCNIAESPLLGGLPRSCCQDQCHWLRKLLKSSLLSTKPLRLGNYTALFSDICQVYEAGPAYGLIKKDIDVHNKSDQKSVERLISDDCLHALADVPWAKGTLFLITVGKEAFEAWWRVDMMIVQRLKAMYYVVKVICLWEKWVQKAELDTSQCFITRELLRDTIVMACGMLHLALIFKLYFPEMPFLPWQWSELHWRAIIAQSEFSMEMMTSFPR
eukprot:Seg2609.3 transcript_id=Seg2609.3/GoldUCD/mRNA.D3Y31 product="hypothetical protein" protein_id=Seg2609.3/GoldUCD/D3Y31